MALVIMFIAMPFVIYIALVTAPSGRWLRSVMLGTAAILAYLWLGYLFSWGPFWTGSARADNYMMFAASIYTIAAVAGAATATLGRRLAKRLKTLGYAPIAILIFVIIFVPMLYVLGV